MRAARDAFSPGAFGLSHDEDSPRGFRGWAIDPLGSSQLRT
jgi:hypothetical protein